MTENGFDTEEEPLSKIPRMSMVISTPVASPAVTLLRRKKRKQCLKSPQSEQCQHDSDKQRHQTKAKRNLLPEILIER